MKRFFTYVIIATASAYYTVAPLMVVKADATSFQGVYATSITTGTSAGTTIPQVPTLIEPADNIVSTLSMRVTAYASVPDETDDTPFITANGTYVHDGVAASNILPFGTKIQIPELFGDKIFTIEDRMSTRIKNTIDIWMPTVRDALVFGATHTEIIVLGGPTSTLALAGAKATAK